MGSKDERCRFLITEARQRINEGNVVRARSVYGQAATLAEELGAGAVEKDPQEGLRWLIDAMVFWREAAKAAQVIRLYRRLRSKPLPPEFSVKADVLLLSTLQKLRDQLSYTDLSGMRLGRIDLRGALLTGAIFRNSEMTGTNLRGAQLKGANFEGAKLHEADLSEAMMTRTYWKGAQLHRVLLNSAILESAMMIDANMEGVILEQAQLDRAILNRSNFRRANFHGANLDGAKLEGTKLTLADLRRANFAHATLEEVDLSGALIEGTIFEGANLVKINLDAIMDSKTVFAGATITGGVLRGYTRTAIDKKRDGRIVMEIDVAGESMEREVKPNDGLVTPKITNPKESRDYYDEPPESGDQKSDRRNFGRKIFDRFRR